MLFMVCSMTELHPRFAEVVEKVETLLNSPKLMVFGRIDAWLKAGADPEIDIYPVLKRIAANGKWNGSTLSYFDGPVAQSIADRTKPLPAAQPRADRERDRKREHSYESAQPVTDAHRDAIDKMRANSLNAGLTVMSVTFQDAKRFHEKGWLTPAAAERFGL